jgi:hypothetical protein
MLRRCGHADSLSSDEVQNRLCGAGASGHSHHNGGKTGEQGGGQVFDLERMNELEVYFESDPEDRRGFCRLVRKQLGCPGPLSNSLASRQRSAPIREGTRCSRR